MKYRESDFLLDIPAGQIDILNGNSKNVGILLGCRTKAKVFLDVSLGTGYHFADYSGRLGQNGRLIPSIISSGIFPKIDLSSGVRF